MVNLSLVDGAQEFDITGTVNELSALRRAAGKSLADVARHVGVSRRLAGYWEQHRKRPPVLRLAAWAAMFNRPLPPDLVFIAFVVDLRSRRVRSGRTQADLAATLNVTRNTFSRWERHWSRPTRRQLELWAGQFGQLVPDFVVMPRLTTAECGYLSGQRQHRRRGEPPCPLCAAFDADRAGSAA